MLLQLFVALAVSIAFGYLFIRDLALGEVLDSLLAVNLVLVGLALVLFALSLLVRAMRWGVFYGSDQPGLRLLFPMVLVTYAGNNLLPLRAGELLRAQMLHDRAGISRMRTFGTAIVERLFDILMLSVFVIAGVLVAGLGYAYLGIGVGLLVASVVGFGIAWLAALRPRTMAGLLDRKWPLIPRTLSSKVAAYLESLIEGFSVLRGVSLFRSAAILTAGAWLLELGMYWLIAEAFNLGRGFLTIAFAGAAANLALSIPSAQSGVGPFQWAAKEALVRVGVASTPAAAYALALHLVLVLPVSAVGMAVFWLMVRNRRAVLREALDPAAAAEDTQGRRSFLRRPMRPEPRVMGEDG